MHRTTIAALLAAGLSLGLGGSPALAQKQTLSLAHWVPSNHLMTAAQRDWIKAVEAASGGDLTIEMDRAPLAKPGGQYDLVKSGVRDIVWHVPGYRPSREELLRVGELPFLCPNAATCSPVIWDWYTKHGLADREFKDVVLLTAWVHGPGLLHTTREVRILEDLKQLKVRVGGAGAPIAKALGMTVMAIPASEAHEALSNGTVDGVIFPWVALLSFRLVDAITYHLEVPGGLYTTSFTLIMNKKTFADLSAANRAALLQESGRKAALFYGERWDAADAQAREVAVEAGHKIQTLSTAEITRWRPKLQFVRDAWLKLANDQGLDGQALLSELEKMIAAATAG